MTYYTTLIETRCVYLEPFSSWSELFVESGWFLPTPPAFVARRGWSRSNFVVIFGTKNWNPWAIVKLCVISMFSRFYTIPECDRQTDTRRRHTHTYIRCPVKSSCNQKAIGSKVILARNVWQSLANGRVMKAQKPATKTQIYFQQKRKCKINKTATRISRSATSVSVLYKE